MTKKSCIFPPAPRTRAHTPSFSPRFHHAKRSVALDGRDTLAAMGYPKQRSNRTICKPLSRYLNYRQTNQFEPRLSILADLRTAIAKPKSTTQTVCRLERHRLADTGLSKNAFALPGRVHITGVSVPFLAQIEPARRAVEGSLHLVRCKTIIHF